MSGHYCPRAFTLIHFRIAAADESLMGITPAMAKAHTLNWKIGDQEENDHMTIVMVDVAKLDKHWQSDSPAEYAAFLFGSDYTCVVWL
jgi:hypothetical protein